MLLYLNNIKNCFVNIMYSRMLLDHLQLVNSLFSTMLNGRQHVSVSITQLVRTMHCYMHAGIMVRTLDISFIHIKR